MQIKSKNNYNIVKENFNADVIFRYALVHADKTMILFQDGVITFATVAGIFNGRGYYSYAERTHNDQHLAMKAIAVLHKQRIERLLGGNAYKDKAHPIFNFLFQYFHFNRRRLLSYSPGLGYDLSNEVNGHCLDVPELMQYTCKQPDGKLMLSPSSKPLDPKKHQAMITTLTLLRNCHSKPPNFGCFGLHEWAMLYRYDDMSSTNNNSNNTVHQTLPLRLSRYVYTLSHTSATPSNTHLTHQLRTDGTLSARDDINAVVERQPLRCSHFDATRFFTPKALPLNRTTPIPSRANQSQLEQPGCIHATMDLFKWAIKVHPYIDSHIIADALELAIVAREIDMRASPYDLTAYKPGNVPTDGIGYSFNTQPICIETVEGRKEYVKHQVSKYVPSMPQYISSLLHSYNPTLPPSYPVLITLCINNTSSNFEHTPGQFIHAIPTNSPTTHQLLSRYHRL